MLIYWISTVGAEVEGSDGLLLVDLEYLLGFLAHAEDLEGVGFGDQGDEVHGVRPEDGGGRVVQGLLEHHLEGVGGLDLHLNHLNIIGGGGGWI